MTLDIVGCEAAARPSSKEPHADQRVEADRLHPLRVQLRNRGSARGRDGSPKIRGDKAHPASRATPATRRFRLDHTRTAGHRLTSPLRRREDGTLRGDRLGNGDLRGRRADSRPSATSTAASRSSLRRRRPGQPPRRRVQRPGPALRSGSRYRSSALAQEKTGEFFVGRASLRRATRAATSRTPRSRSSSARTLAVAELPARPRGPA